jgi:hypothetical protein
MSVGSQPPGVDTVEGTKDSLVSLGLRLSKQHGVTITITGPADGNWFGIGFDTRYMADSPYAIVIDGNGKVSEHMLADHAGGIVLNSSVTVVSQSVSNGQRTVVLTRALKVSGQIV